MSELPSRRANRYIDRQPVGMIRSAVETGRRSRLPLAHPEPHGRPAELSGVFDACPFWPCQRRGWGSEFFTVVHVRGRGRPRGRGRRRGLVSVVGCIGSSSTTSCRGVRQTTRDREPRPTHGQSPGAKPTSSRPRTRGHNDTPERRHGASAGRCPTTCRWVWNQCLPRPARHRRRSPDSCCESLERFGLRRRTT
jgi:hypothetical protein